MATLCRAFDLLDRGDVAADRSLDTLRVEILVKMHLASGPARQVAPLIERAVRIFPLISSRDGFPRDIVTVAVRHGMTTPEAQEIYLQFLEAGGELEGPLRGRLDALLVRALRISRRALPDEVRHQLPALERLQRCRPGLDFPQLYLGRFHHLDGNHERAEEHLAAIRGPLAETVKVLTLRGHIAERQGRLEDARRLYERSLELDEGQPDVQFRVGRLALWAALAINVEEQASTRHTAPPSAPRTEDRAAAEG